MSYQLTEVTIRTNNTEESKKADLWRDIENGKLPLMFDSDHTFISGVSPVSKYSNYQNTDCGDYDYSIIAVRSNFFRELENKIAEGKYIKIETSDVNGDEQACAKEAWCIAKEKTDNGSIKRNYIEDFESTVPKEYTKDGQAHCYLYLGVN